MTKFWVFSRTWAYDVKILFLFPYFDVVHSNLVPGEFASIFQVKQIAMIAKELQKREDIFLNDILVTVAIFVSWTALRRIHLILENYPFKTWKWVGFGFTQVVFLLVWAKHV